MRLNKLVVNFLTISWLPILFNSSESAISFSDQSSLTAYRQKFVSIAQTDYLRKVAGAITVKVATEEESWGSGVLVDKQESSYTLLTNDHVVRSKKILVTTIDGKVHIGELLLTLRPYAIDIALVRFQSTQAYAIATISNHQNISEGDFAFAAGYPLDKKNANNANGLKMTGGHVSLNLENPLRYGDQLGYTNWIERGMSGGPVLDINGSLIAINARHAYPFNANSYIFQDPNLAPPCKPLRNLMFRSAFGIPIDVAVSQSQKKINLILERYGTIARPPITGIPPVIENFAEIDPQRQSWESQDIALRQVATRAKKCQA